jgi:hypothetical protein
MRYAAAKYSRPLPESSRDRRIDPDIGPLYFWEGTYPGWSYFTAAAFVLPTNWQFTRIYFCFVNALALAATAVWAYRLGRPHSVAGGIFLAASALAIFANYRALNRGQYGLIVNGLLIGVYVLMEKHKPTAAGFLYGLAAIKPHSSALLAIVFLVRKQWKLLAVTVGYVAFASLCVWALSKTNPLEMLKQAIDAGMTRGSDGGSSSLLSLLLKLNVHRTVATRVSAVVGLVSTATIAWIWRKATTLSLFAMAATIGRLWTYHHSYDNVMLVFLVVALGEAFLMRYSNSMAFAFFIVGVSLWTPDRFIPGGHSLPVQIAQMISWLVGLAILLASDPRPSQPLRQNKETDDSSAAQPLHVDADLPSVHLYNVQDDIAVQALSKQCLPVLMRQPVSLGL